MKSATHIVVWLQPTVQTQFIIKEQLWQSTCLLFLSSAKINYEAPFVQELPESKMAAICININIHTYSGHIEFLKNEISWPLIG